MKLPIAKDGRVCEVPIFDEEDYTFYRKSYFHHLLHIERCRTERSKKPFLLLLLDVSALIAEERHEEIMGKLHSALQSALRETDIRGWYYPDRIIGIIFTEIKSVDRPSIDEVIRKLRGRLEKKLTVELLAKISISFHIFPETPGNMSTGDLIDVSLIPDLSQKDLTFRMSLTVKRAMDIMISVAALLSFAPILLVIATTVKCTSDGPVFFRQERLGAQRQALHVFEI